ncbi:hypothetical protein [Methylobacterium bullatum]|uniref:Uncharacterized protein n=1 Tax=Methylobacterium bullatum TaxID=570505 RepID=A0A679JHM3_9HYPH|nr:hypothetical protein MBLL_00395 [Methylobacterium bullatum]
MRREAGEWSQCAENYGALTLHHLSCGKLRPTVAYVRKLLFVTEGASSPEERLNACLLAATVYVAVHQVTPARNHAVEAAGIAAHIGDAKGLVEAEQRFAQI